MWLRVTAESTPVSLSKGQACHPRHNTGCGTHCAGWLLQCVSVSFKGLGATKQGSKTLNPFSAREVSRSKQCSPPPRGLAVKRLNVSKGAL
ncbi:hypothetical protein FKM82_014978 [Ascaphus truei]